MATERKMKLKACPFCGGEAFYSDVRIRFVCRVPDCRAEGPTYDNYRRIAWNRRPSRPRGKAQKGRK